MDSTLNERILNTKINTTIQYQHLNKPSVNSKITNYNEYIAIAQDINNLASTQEDSAVKLKYEGVCPFYIVIYIDDKYIKIVNVEEIRISYTKNDEEYDHKHEHNVFTMPINIYNNITTEQKQDLITFWILEYIHF